MAVEVIAGLLTSAVVKIAEDKLSSAVKEQASLCWNFNGDLEVMKDTMVSVAAVLADAEKQSVKKDSESVRLWLKRLKHAALDISDMMDNYFQEEDTGTGISQKVPGMLSCFTAAPKRIALANKMKNMRDKLERIDKERQRFTFAAESTSAGIQNQRQWSSTKDQQRETTSSVDETKIIGRDGVKKEIINILSASHKEEDGTALLPIYGLGGMGKSTMAQLVYNDDQSIKHYEHRVWVYVSEVFDLKKIGRSVISQLATDGAGHQDLDTLQMIYNCLDKQLPGKKILIVLDDVWQEDAKELDKLKNMLHVGKKGSMLDVLVTTRSESIANKICTNQPYKLPPLADNVCWDIIKQHSGFKEKSNKKKLEEIGLDIAKKCGGVALAAQALGYMLKEEDLEGWSKMNKSDIWNESFGGDGESPHKKVLPSLKLSYERMPPILRLCFSYCVIFPKGHDIYEDDLVHQWIALDFIKETVDGRKYVKQLLGMSFLQHSKLPITSTETATRYTMHDLARSVVGDELIVIDAAEKVKTNEQKFCRYAMLKNYAGQTKLSDILPKKVRALNFSTCSKMDLRDRSFSFMKRLGILDLSEYSGVQLPSSIGQLKQLKCLIAPHLQDKSLPEAIGELSRLQYLNLRGSSLISELPESIGKLSCLMYLSLSGCSGILKIPDSIGGLKSLIHLDMSDCSGITLLPGTLGNLTNLQHLDLSRCSGVGEIPESLGGLNELQHLDLSYCVNIKRLPEAIGCLNKLQYLYMASNERIKELPGSFKNLQSLVHLNLSHCHCGKGLPEALCGLTSLEHLNISYISFTTSGEVLWKDISDAMGNLTNLKYLSMRFTSLSFSDFIGSLTNLEHLDIDFIGSLTNLEHLELSRCSGVVEVPESLGGLNELQHLNLSHCGSIIILPEAIGCLNKLRYLDMEYNQHIKELPGSFKNLQSLVHINLSHCCCRKGLSEALCGLNSLEHLNISYISFTTSREELWKDISDAMGNLTNLKYLSVRFTSLSSSDFIGSLTNLEHLDLSYTRIVSLPEGIGNLKKLCTLDLSYCSRLKSLPDSIGEIAVLNSLLIEGCSDELIEMADSILHNS